MWVYTGGGAPVRSKQADRPGKSQIGIRGTKDRAWSRQRTWLQDDRGRARRRQQLLVLRVGDEGDIAGAGVLNACNSRDLDLTVPFQEAFESGSEIAEFHVTRL